jgi:hypothetical protein
MAHDDQRPFLQAWAEEIMSDSRYTDKKNQIFLIYKESQSGAVEKSYLTKDLLSPHIWGNLCAFPHI